MTNGTQQEDRMDSPSPIETGFVPHSALRTQAGFVHAFTRRSRTGFVPPIPLGAHRNWVRSTHSAQRPELGLFRALRLCALA